MDLAHCRNNTGARHRTKRYGCGIGSGHGKTCGRGGKGQTARTGSSIRAGFEGGQMPLYRRIPKRGFNSFSQETYGVVNVEQLNAFADGAVVTPAALRKNGLVCGVDCGIKILGDGELTKKKLTVVASAFSNTAIAKIEAAAGQCRVAKRHDILKDYRGEGALDVAAAVQAKPAVPAGKRTAAEKKPVAKKPAEEKKPAEAKTVVPKKQEGSEKEPTA